MRVSPERRVPFYVLCGTRFHAWLVLLTIVEDSCRCGVSVPGVRFVDAANGVLGIEWVNGESVRYLLGSRDEDENEAGADEDPLAEYAISKGTISDCDHFRTSILTGPDALMEMVGTEIAKMHLGDIIHGDLTTSNMMLRHPSSISDSRPGTQQLVSETNLVYYVDRQAPTEMLGIDRLWIGIHVCFGRRQGGRSVRFGARVCVYSPGK